MESLVCYKLDLGCVTTRSKGTIFPSTVAKVADRSTFITLFHTLHNPSIQKSGFLKEMRQGSGAWHGQKARVIASKTWVAYWVATSQTSFDFASIKSISKVLQLEKSFLSRNFSWKSSLLTKLLEKLFHWNRLCEEREREHSQRLKRHKYRRLPIFTER